MDINDIKKNASPMNKGTNYGNNMICCSIKKLGLGRSIVVDKDNVILCGEKVFDSCLQLGIKKIKIVETNGDTLVVVKRSDIQSNDKKGLEMSLVDNLSCAENIEWNTKNVQKNMNENLGFNPIEWGGDSCCVEDLDIKELLNENTGVIKQNAKNKTFNEPRQISLFE